MIHIFIGTKAQYVKTAPVIRKLDQRGIEYNLIDSGQHAQLQHKYRKYFGIRTPDLFLREGKQDITSVFIVIGWFLVNFFEVLIFRKKAKRKFFRNKKGVCIVHGDTPTTLLSILIAKMCGVEILHLEAGLRSFDIFNPFPEEIIRVITMNIADILCVSSKWAENNLRKIKFKKKVLRISANTGLDAMRYSLKQQKPCEIYLKNYCLISIHRFENIISKRKISKIAELVQEIATNKKVIFPLHSPTKRQLLKFGILEALQEKSNIILSDLLSHTDFLHFAEKADFIITDGGSVQEESYYLGVPCLLLRNCTERQEGIGENVIISKFDNEIINDFLLNFKRYISGNLVELKVCPSKEIVDYLVKSKYNNSQKPVGFFNGFNRGEV